LNVVTQTFFEQKDFSKMEILSDFYTNLSEQLSKPLTDAVLFNGRNYNIFKLYLKYWSIPLN